MFDGDGMIGTVLGVALARAAVLGVALPRAAVLALVTTPLGDRFTGLVGVVVGVVVGVRLTAVRLTAVRLAAVRLAVGDRVGLG
ncbi:MAG TPA: hypothetical protein VGX49_05470, partial [Jatrophihabitans sp.]|nr:hypothetical protein [Jatrophihabitans sp.]